MELKKFLEQLKTISKGYMFKPHKYLLLLTIIDLIQSGKIKENKFYFNDELKKLFSINFNKYSRSNDRNRPHTPFFHLKSSGFWHLRAKQGREEFLNNLSKLSTVSEITDNVDYAYLSEPVYFLFKEKESADVIKEEIILILLNYKNKKLSLYEENESYNVNFFKDSLFKHEENAISSIKNLIKDVSKTLHNIYIYDKQSNNYLEYDMIIVAHTGIYVLELKHWTGHIKIAPYNWVINETHFRSDPHKVNIFKCKVLKGYYQHHFRTYPDVWVESVVVLTNPDAAVEGYTSPVAAVEQNIKNPTFSSINDFVTYLRKKESDFEARRLDDRQIDAVVKYLSGLNSPKPKVIYNVPGFETVEYISQKAECIELVARPVGGRARGLNRIRIFRTPHQATPEEKARFQKKAYNTLDAVSRIGDHPHIHKVWVIKNDEGDIIEGSDWSETGTLRSVIQENGVIPPEQAVKICRGIALALKEAHDAGVIHRAVKPENVLMVNDIPKLMNFDLSYQLEENRVTVITDVSRMKDDGYVAPEILSGDDIDEGTDFFGLGVIAYELFTGIRPFASTREFLAQGGVLNDQAVKKLTEAGTPTQIVDVIMNMLVAERNKRLKDSAVITDAFGEEPGEIGHTAPAVSNHPLPPGSSYDLYEIIEQIGQGAEAQIYKAKSIRGIVALKLFNREVHRERIFRESEITSAVKSAYVVHCEDKLGYWDNDRFFMVMNYVEGESLRRMIERKEKPDLDTFRSVTLSLMEAVNAFHGYKDEDGSPRPLLHSDIKPDNIIMTKDMKPVLIDCGIAGEPRVDIYQGTAGYVPPDCILGTDMKFSQDGDLFALGVTLWEWLFSEKPYINPAVGDTPVIPGSARFEVGAGLREWLLKAVATVSSERFGSVEEMREAFIKVFTVLPAEPNDDVDVDGDTSKTEINQPDDTLPGVEEYASRVHQPEEYNQFVSYLNTLSNASAGNENANAECQVNNVHFGKIIVKNPVANYISDKIFSERLNVILTGNAGDGKTTIAHDIYKTLTGNNLPPDSVTEITDHKLVIVKDLSEVPENERPVLLAEAIKDQVRSYLIVSNTGTLLQSFKKLGAEKNEKYDSELLNALKSEHPRQVLEGHFLVVNIGMTDSINTAMEVFKRMLAQENWVNCRECPYNEDCSVYVNARLLQDNLNVVIERVLLIYRRMFEYGIRLTMRQMTGHLAYAITAGRDCNFIAGMSKIARQDNLPGALFFNRFFGDDGKNINPEALQLMPVRQVIKSEFGVQLDPLFERKVWMNMVPVVSGNGILVAIYQKLAQKYSGGSPELRRQVRRLAYFFSPINDAFSRRSLSIFLRSPMLVDYMEITGANGKLAPLRESNLRKKILHVLQEFFAGVRLPEGNWQASEVFITLNNVLTSSRTQMVLASFSTEDFQLHVKPVSRLTGGKGGILTLRHKHGGVEMVIDLPFLDYVFRRYGGEVAEELSVFYADRLKRFKVGLLNLYHGEGLGSQQNLRLLRVGQDRSFKIARVIVTSDRLEVLQ